MTDAMEQWRAYLASGRSFSVDADRSVTEARLRANRVGLVVSAAITVLAAAGLVVLIVTDGGRAATYVAVGAFVLSMIILMLRLWSLRRRLHRFAAAPDPLVVVSAESVTISGMPPIAWRDVLGVVASDLTGEYAAARGIGGWLRRTAIRTGGTAIGLSLGIERAAAYRAGADGGLVHDLIVVADDNGQAGLSLDNALPVDEARRVVTAIKAAASLNDVGFVLSNEAKDGLTAAATFLQGKRLVTASTSAQGHPSQTSPDARADSIPSDDGARPSIAVDAEPTGAPTHASEAQHATLLEATTTMTAPAGIERRTDDMTDAALTREQWEATYLDRYGNLRPVPNNGAIPGQRVQFTDIAAFLRDFPADVDLLGTPDDEFLTIMGGSFDQRMQLPTDASGILTAYSFTGSLPTGFGVELGTNMAALGRSGGARYVTVLSAAGGRLSVFELLDLEVLVERAA